MINFTQIDVSCRAEHYTIRVWSLCAHRRESNHRLPLFHRLCEMSLIRVKLSPKLDNLIDRKARTEEEKKMGKIRRQRHAHAMRRR